MAGLIVDLHAFVDHGKLLVRQHGKQVWGYTVGARGLVPGCSHKLAALGDVRRGGGVGHRRGLGYIVSCIVTRAFFRWRMCLIFLEGTWGVEGGR